MFYLFSNNVLVNFNEVVCFKRTQNRIIINLSYSIVKNNEEYVEYVYIDNYTDSDLAVLNTKFFKDNFIQVSKVYINKNKISSIKYNNGKIIYNLSVVKSHLFNKNGNTEKVISSVFYYELGDIEKFNSVVYRLKKG